MVRNLIILKAKSMRFPCFFAMMLALLPWMGHAQDTFTATGTVRSADASQNNPALQGVSVTLKGSNAGTTTDQSGRFSIEVPSTGAILVFNYLGYETREVSVSANQSIDVLLSPVDQQLEEVVVVGYGTQRKSDLTGSVGLVSGKELLQAPVTNALQGLKGRVAGVNVFLNSGSPTSSPRILIRGLGTINSSSNPLFVVDGVVMENIQFL